MTNIALREMILAVQAESPGIGRKRLTAQLNNVLPETEKKTSQEVRVQLENLDRPEVQPKSGSFRPIVEEAIKVFRDAERAYLLGVDQEVLRFAARHIEGPAPSWIAASQWRHYYEILLTLLNVKPCTLITINRSAAAKKAFNGMVIKCLAPMMEQFELESWGFTLRYLAHDVWTELHPAHEGFKGGWVFANTRSPQWDKVNDIFLVPHPGRLHQEDSVGAALGYPLPDGNVTVTFVDEKETERLKEIAGEEVGDVFAYEFFAQIGDAAQAQTLERYVKRCRDIAKQFGAEMLVDIS